MGKETKAQAAVLEVSGASPRLSVEACLDPVGKDARFLVCVPADGDLDVGLFDIFGYKVADLFCAPCPAGILTISFKSELFPNGIYYCIAKMNGKNAYCEITLARPRLPRLVRASTSETKRPRRDRRGRDE